jgi:hypothetical protein
MTRVEPGVLARAGGQPRDGKIGRTAIERRLVHVPDFRSIHDAHQELVFGNPQPVAMLQGDEIAAANRLA